MKQFSRSAYQVKDRVSVSTAPLGEGSCATSGTGDEILCAFAVFFLLWLFHHLLQYLDF
jgi:hypothetical protein